MSEYTLHHGDCLDVLPTLPAQSVDAVICDPPYNVVGRNEKRTRYTRPMRKAGYFHKGEADTAPVNIEQWTTEMVRVVRGSVYVFCGTEQVSAWRTAFVTLGLSTRQCVWVKTNPAPVNGEKMWLSAVELCVYARKPKATFNRFCVAPVWRGPSERVAGFPCPKPLWLMRELIEASTNEGDTVLDPCMGSGTTGHACVNLGRRFIGVEQSADYYAIAARRLADAAAAPRQASFAEEAAA